MIRPIRGLMRRFLRCKWDGQIHLGSKIIDMFLKFLKGFTIISFLLFAVKCTLDKRHIKLSNSTITYEGKELTIGELAKKYLPAFQLHPAFLDGSTFSLAAGMLNKMSAKPYIPLSINRFRSKGKLKEKCYVLVKDFHVVRSADEDVVVESSTLPQEFSEVLLPLVTNKFHLCWQIDVSLVP